MGKATGFLEYSRVEEPFRPEMERLKDFACLHETLPTQARRQQAARCMNCGVPFCQSGVTLGGMTSGWGVEHMSERLPEDGDLYLFCWGMNDGSADVPPEVFEVVRKSVRQQRQ